MTSPCCLCVLAPPPPNVVRQRLGKHVPAATNTHAIIEDILDAALSVRSLSY
jgi:hypothetical protein